MRRMMSLAAIAFAGGASAPALGQSWGLIDRHDVAGSRPQLGYDATALRFGAITVLPVVTFSAGYSANVSGRANLSQPDAEFVIAPSIVAQTDWTRHFVSAQFSAKISRYARYKQYNDNEYTGKLDGRYDIDDSTTVSPSVSYGREVERYGLNGTNATFGANSASRTAEGGLAAQHRFGRFDLSGQASYERRNYEDLLATNGSEVSQSFRDTRSVGGAVRLGYNIGPAISLLLTYKLNVVNSLHPSPGFLRDNRQQSASGGIVLNPGGLVDASINIGYLQERFKNPAFKDFSGLTYDLRFDWYPTSLITVTAQANRSLTNSGIINVGALITDKAFVRIDYELLRNLLLHATITYTRDQYPDVGVATSRWNGEIRADYSINNWALLGIYADHISRHSSDTSRLVPASVTQGGMALTLHP